MKEIDVAEQAYKNGYDDGMQAGLNKALTAVPAVREWRPASEPPKDENEVLVCTVSKSGLLNIDKGYYFGDRWVHRGSSQVAYWMPLPEFPDELIK